MRTAIHVFDDASLFHIAAPQMVFGEVARLGLAADWTTTLWSLDGGPVRTAEGNTLSDVAGPSAADDADIVVVPTWPVDLPPIGDGLRTVILEAHARGALIVGLCLGAVAVADTGLIAGRSAVTHWQWMSLLAERDPSLRMDSSVLYIDHGDVITSAGTAASIDACLHIVRRFLGASRANRVARGLVVAPHRDGGQAQYIERPVAEHPAGEPVSEVCGWALAHLDHDLSIDVLAGRARMSRRSFVRHFRAVTGTSPTRWVLEQRLSEVRVLLERTHWGMDRVAHACGFGSAVTMRQNFVKVYATTPSTYRASFGVEAADVSTQ